jgi:hypothetical protein
VTLSPTLLVFVQTFAVGVSESVVPAAIVPTEPPLFDAPVLGCVTVFPLAVVFGVVGRDDELLDELELEVRGVVRGVLRDGADVAGGFAGTSFNCGCAAVSPRFAIAWSCPSCTRPARQRRRTRAALRSGRYISPSIPPPDTSAA